MECTQRDTQERKKFKDLESRDKKDSMPHDPVDQSELSPRPRWGLYDDQMFYLQGNGFSLP